MSGRDIERNYETEREVKTRRKREQEEWARHGGYMNAKVQKLINKYDSDKSREKHESQSKLFENVAIFVNGYTEPSFDVLRNYMIEGGGRFEHYYSATRVTHIVATSLALSKQKLFSDEKVVLPSWITDSVKKNSLQPYEKYLLLKRNKITNFFTSRESAPWTGSDVIDPLEINDVAEDAPQSSTSKELYSSTTEDLPGTTIQQEQSKKGGKSSALNMLSADQPGFVAEFYGNSRLHHLSEWRTQLKDLVNEIRADPEHRLTGRDHLVHKYLDSSKPSSSPLALELSSHNKSTSSVYMHIDMDCFFVSVVLRQHPELKDSPVVVAHSKGDVPGNQLYSSMSQIASCNYVARQAGVKNGMMMGKALSLCPDLQVLPYDFDGYSEVSRTLYHTVASYTTKIEAVSCDELYVDITSLLSIVTYDQLAQEMRQDIRSRTGCPCSAGMGGNLLLARLATRSAKPDGQYYISPQDVIDFVSKHQVNDLPGVGRVTSRLLEKQKVETCAQLQAFSLAKLKDKFGAKTGESLYKLCRGQDDRQLRPDQPRQSVSCDVNYGIRLTDAHQVELLFENIAAEVSKKLRNARLLSKQVTLKLKVRSADAPTQSAKFMGHGICDNMSKSSSLKHPTDGTVLIKTVCLNIWRGWNILPSDLRGVGIQMTKLQQVQTCTRRDKQTDLLNFVGKGKTNATSPAKPVAIVISDDEDNGAKKQILDTNLPSVTPEVPALCGYSRLEGVFDVLNRWVMAERGGPCDKDMVRFTEYLLSLVTLHHTDLLQKVLLHLKYLVIRDTGSEWGNFYLKVKSAAKEAVEKEYNMQIEL